MATNTTPKTTARILVSVGDSRKGLEFTDIDFTTSRNKIALQVGLRIVDAIFDLAEKEGEV